MNTQPSKDMEKVPGKEGKRLVLRTLKVLLFCTILYFIYRAVAGNYDQIRSSLQDIRIGWLLFATATVTCYLFCQSMIWRRILRDLEIHVQWTRAVKLFFVSLLGKYIPGKIWIVAMRIGLSGFTGASKGRLLLSITLEHFFILATSVILFFLTSRQISMALLGLLAILLLLAAPNFWLSGIDFLLSLAGREQMKTRLDPGSSARYIFLYLSTWTLLGCGVWMCSYSIHPLGLEHLMHLGGMYALSFAAGFVAPFAPGGLGVREGAFILLSTPVLTAPVATVTAIILRLVFSAAELLGLGLVLLIGDDTVEE